MAVQLANDLLEVLMSKSTGNYIRVNDSTAESAVISSNEASEKFKIYSLKEGVSYSNAFNLVSYLNESDCGLLGLPSFVFP